MAAFGYTACNTGAFCESARLYNPKLFASLSGRKSKITLGRSPKIMVNQFATNLEHVLGDAEGNRQPMRTDASADLLYSMSATSAA